MAALSASWHWLLWKSRHGLGRLATRRRRAREDEAGETSGQQKVPPREAMEEPAEAGVAHHLGHEGDEPLEHEATDRPLRGMDVEHHHPADEIEEEIARRPRRRVKPSHRRTSTRRWHMARLDRRKMRGWITARTQR